MDFPVAELLANSDMSESVVFTQSGVSSTIRAVYVPAYQVTDMMGTPVSNPRPAVLVDADDVDGVDQLCTVKRGAITYNVAEVHQETAGFVTLILTRD